MIQLTGTSASIGEIQRIVYAISLRRAKDPSRNIHGWESLRERIGAHPSTFRHILRYTHSRTDPFYECPRCSRDCDFIESLDEWACPDCSLYTEQTNGHTPAFCDTLWVVGKNSPDCVMVETCPYCRMSHIHHDLAPSRDEYFVPVRCGCRWHGRNEYIVRPRIAASGAMLRVGLFTAREMAQRGWHKKMKKAEQIGGVVK